MPFTFAHPAVVFVFLLVVMIKKLIGFDNTWGQPIAITISAGLLAVTAAPELARLIRILS